MSLAAGLAHMGCRRGFQPLFDWSTVSGATVEWDADDLVNGAQGVDWVDRIGGVALTPSGSPLRDAGSHGRGRVALGATSTTKYASAATGVPLAMIGGSHSSDYLVICVADLRSHATGSFPWGDCSLWSCSGVRIGHSWRRRATGPDIYAHAGWLYDGSFQPPSASGTGYDIGGTLSGTRVYHIRKQGDKLYSGIGGVWSSFATVAAAISPTIGSVLNVGINANSPTASHYLYKLCAKGGSGTDEPAAIAAFVSEYS